MVGMLESWKRRARQLRAETYALYLAYRDPRTPWYVKGLIALIVAYAFSPIDLIPDPIPILGYLDDLLLVPLGIALVLRMIPPVVLDECREQARLVMDEGNPTSWAAAAVVIGIWLIVAVALIYAIAGLLQR
jgi:uncharacterized membrane protein YkvA (DUF1232 family)